MKLKGKVLHLVLTGKWYDMIESWRKREEYREITPYWINRLRSKGLVCIDHAIQGDHCSFECWKSANCGFENFKWVIFHRGYTNTTTAWEFKHIRIGRGKPEWGAPADRDVFIIELGEQVPVKCLQHGE